MGKIINCSRCGRFFESDGWTVLCMECIEQDERDFRRIREYLYEKPGAKIFEVSIELDVPVAKIKRYLREDRLEIIEKNNIFLKCEACGKPICSGIYCDDCAKQAGHDYKTIFTGSSTGNKSGTQLRFNKASGKYAAK